MKRYILDLSDCRTLLMHGWPKQLPLRDGQHETDFDLIEDEIEDREWLVKRRNDSYEAKREAGASDEALFNSWNRPLGLQREAIPPCATLTELKGGAE